MLTQVQFDAAAAEVTTMVGMAITGGMGIYGSLKGVFVGLQIFSRLIQGR
jgi:prolipoprotein diacylglyceryltransferase